MLTADSSVSCFMALEQSFGNTNLSDPYSPWISLDHFDRAQVREALEPCVEGQEGLSVLSEPKGIGP